MCPVCSRQGYRRRALVRERVRTARLQSHQKGRAAAHIEIMFRATRRAIEEGRMTDVQRRMVYLRVIEAVVAEHAPARGANTRAVRGPGADDASQALASPEEGGP